MAVERRRKGLVKSFRGVPQAVLTEVESITEGKIRVGEEGREIQMLFRISGGLGCVPQRIEKQKHLRNPEGDC